MPCAPEHNLGEQSFHELSPHLLPLINLGQSGMT
jgi:hypothetical protein